MQASNSGSSAQQSYNSVNFEKKTFSGQEKPKDVRRGNIISAKGKLENK